MVSATMLPNFLTTIKTKPLIDTTPPRNRLSRPSDMHTLQRLEFTILAHRTNSAVERLDCIIVCLTNCRDHAQKMFNTLPPFSTPPTTTGLGPLYTIHESDHPRSCEFYRCELAYYTSQLAWVRSKMASLQHICNELRRGAKMSKGAYPKGTNVFLARVRGNIPKWEAQVVELETEVDQYLNVNHVDSREMALSGVV